MAHVRKEEAKSKGDRLQTILRLVQEHPISRQEVLLDYLVAFMALGMAELFARPFKNRMVGVAVGTAVAGFLRFMCSFLSGVLVWGNLSDGLSAWTYSLVYNASYMLPETLITVVGAVLLIRVAPQIFDRQYAKV